MYQQIIRDIQQDYYQQKYANDGQRFIAWYLCNVHQRDFKQAFDDITDGPDDKQIDAILVDDNAQIVYIIQGKFINLGSVDAGPLREVISSWLRIRDLIKLQEDGNNKLKRKLSELSQALDDGYEVCFELLTTGVLTEGAKKDLEYFQEQFANLSDNSEFTVSLRLIDEDEICRRYDLSLDKENPTIVHDLDLSMCEVLSFAANGTKVVIAVVPLSECIRLPGIKDGTLFRKNVRQSLGLSNNVNKGIRNTINSDKHRDFFFFHNGITAICNRLEVTDTHLHLEGLSVVNGCQSLNTILNCSMRVKTLENTNVLFRFYEIPQMDRADKISINTNSQSAVKPRDLRSNDKRVLNLKRVYELKYPLGFFSSKRGECTPADKDDLQVIDLAEFGKYLMSWHSQRPNVAYSETKIFDKYFDQLFKRDYTPENMNALNRWMQAVMRSWGKDNPLGLNESLLVMRAYAPYHHMYAVSMCYAIANNRVDRVPSPEACFCKATKAMMINDIVKIAGVSLNMALETAVNESQPMNKVFSPQNWIKTKTCLSAINFAIRNYFGMLPMMPGGPEMKAQLDSALKLEEKDFEYRWAAD